MEKPENEEISKSDNEKGRPAIPEPIARQVRQECYFGCVMCGNPVFHYDHIEEYAEVREHKAENLALLCPDHHNAKTTGKLTAERVKDAKTEPFNKNRAKTSGYEIGDNRTVEITLGSEIFRPDLPLDSSLCVVYVNGFSYLTVSSENGWLSLSLSVTNESGEVVLAIVKGELKVATGVFDYSYEGDHLVVRTAMRQILIDLNLTNARLEVNKGMFMHSTGTGFSVANGIAEIFVRGSSKGKISKSTYSGYLGGWAVWDKTQFPEAQEPKNFAYVLRY